MGNKTLSIMLGMLLFIVGSAAYAALPPRITWSPAQFAPASMSPGGTASYTVSLKHTGILPIPLTNQLRIVAEGDIAPFVVISQSTFPRIFFNRGDEVTFQVTVTIPANATEGERTGNLALMRVLRNRVVEVWRADMLPITISVMSSMTPKQKVQSLEEQGAIPKLDRSSDIQGPDVNNNGIRDDVETFIATNYASPPQRAAAEQFAKVIQAAMLVDKNDPAAVKATSLKSSKAVHCIYARFDGNAGTKQPAAVVEEVESISASTKARLLAYLAFSKALDGTAGSVPEGDTCE